MVQPMSGMFFEYPGVRFSRQVRVLMRPFAFLLVRRVTHAVRHSFRSTFRLKAAEFPAATQSAFERRRWTERGLRAADRASIGALRPNCNSVNIEDHYGNSFIGKKFTASANWRCPAARRGGSSLPAEINGAQSAGKKIVLGQDHDIFRQWKPIQRRSGETAQQWLTQRRDNPLAT